MASATGKEEYDKLVEIIESPAMEKAFTRALNNRIPTVSWLAAAKAAIWRDKKLRTANRNSVVNVLMQAATMGLRFEDALGQAYLSARENWKHTEDHGWQLQSIEAQLQVGYRGLIDLALRNKEVRSVDARLVYEHDNIDFQNGSTPYLNHTWDATAPKKDRGKLVSVYAGLRFVDGFYSFEVYPYADVLEQRDKTLLEKGIIVMRTEDGEELYFKREKRNMRYNDEVTPIKDNDGEITSYCLEQSNGKGRLFPLSKDDLSYIPWIQHPIPMVKKTAVRWSSKYWPLSEEFQSAVYFAETEENGLKQQIDDAVKKMIPDQVRRQLEENIPNAVSKVLAPAQSLSMTKSRNLANQMAAEANLVKPKAETAQAQGTGKEGPENASGDEDSDEKEELERIRKNDEARKSKSGRKRK